ncbi:MAG: DinB family protein [Pseudomonadota bacterium]
MQSQTSLTTIISANIETLDQTIGFLSDLDNSTFNAVMEPWMSSSIGGHLRHIADTYRAVILAQQSRQVDFNFRRRNSGIETHLQQARKEIRNIRQWIENLDQNLNYPLSLVTEVTLTKSRGVELNSNLARELVFASSHAIHHLAQMATLARLQGLNVNAAVGIAAATATHRRSTALAG